MAYTCVPWYAFECPRTGYRYGRLVLTIVYFMVYRGYMRIFVISSDHRDAWTLRAVDPNSGTVALLKILEAAEKKAGNHEEQLSFAIGMQENMDIKLITNGLRFLGKNHQIS
ncbi:hypothetical protein L1987_02948 [Smallanthus sonchifolius]|uniref:Uncharacterized protein n=1 Tax=Smallanthus sonchifolius TaxID=185202 RepID=A0ACB9K9C5_9ASTR|nr:hypothetical protein L1987_02948 [Smallanthus sonchifolius]